jgi:hypothetical protein
MLAARAEPKNGPKENKKTGNFKPVVFDEYQTGVDICQLGLPKPDEATATAISRGINMSFQIACLALGWTRLVGQLAPQMQPGLIQILNDKDATASNWVFGWLDIPAGRHVLGISGYFEDQAGAIRSDWAEIEKELQSG